MALTAFLFIFAGVLQLVNGASERDSLREISIAMTFLVGGIALGHL